MINRYSYAPSSTGEVMGWISYEIYEHPTGGKQNNAHDTSLIIDLHMPRQLEDKVEAEYTEGTDAVAKSGTLGSAIVDAVNNFDGDFKGSLKNVMESAGKNLKDKAPELLGNVTAAVAENSGITKAITGIDGEMVKRSIEKRTGSVPNPHEEMFFQNIGIREFTFQHKLISFDEKDSYTIQQILKNFKYHSSPGVSSENHRLLYPSQFRMKFYRWVNNRAIENEWLPKIEPCVLTSVEVNYAASDGWAVHSTGAPVDIELSLSFREIKPKFRDEYLTRI